MGGETLWRSSLEEVASKYRATEDAKVAFRGIRKHGSKLSRRIEPIAFSTSKMFANTSIRLAANLIMAFDRFRTWRANGARYRCDGPRTHHRRTRRVPLGYPRRPRSGQGARKCADGARY